MTPRRVRIASLIVLILVSQLFSVTAQDSGYKMEPSQPMIILEKDNTDDLYYEYTVDSSGNIHLLSKHSSNFLSYSLYDSVGSKLIGESQIFQTSNSSKNFDVFANSDDTIHIVWKDYSNSVGYHMSIDSSTSSKSGAPVYINDIVTSEKQSLGISNFSKFDVTIDSKDDIHMIYVDDTEKNLLKYSMYRQLQSGTLQTLISPSDVVEGLGSLDNPSLALDNDDNLVISWDEARGSKIELVFIVDTSGSMYSEWADLCTLLYGGNFAAGGYYRGLKNVAEEYNTSIFETVYGLGNTLPSVAQSGNCAEHYQNGQGPRNTALGENDDSGGLRVLPGTVYNGATYSGYSGEDWGPGSNWACLSWKDAIGNVPGNPPTSADHKWNSSATKFVLPLSDEGPKDGDPAQQADDITSINEAHDNCVNAGVIPVGLHGQSYGGAGGVESHMMDLAYCPNGVVSTNSRNCLGNSTRSTNAQGDVAEYPNGNNPNVYSDFIDFFESVFFERTSHNIFLKILDPMVQINDPSIVLGSNISNLDSLTIKNDTYLKSEKGDSVNPVIHIDDTDQIHIVWSESKVNSLGEMNKSQILYTKENYNSLKSQKSIVNSNFSIEIISSESEDFSNSNPILNIDDLNKPQISWTGFNGTNFTIFHSQNHETSIIANGSLNLTKEESPKLKTSQSFEGSFYMTWIGGNNDCNEGSLSENKLLCFVSFSDRDSDNDGVTNDLDECPGYDDNVDLDNDSIPDGCDNFVDSDGDGVSDSNDRCPNWDDNIDIDNDSIPDGCDAIIDSDGDGVQDISDICEGFDDSIDIDFDGTPDGCDDNVDSDNDGISNLNDKCPGYDDNIDKDSDGLPDDCDNLIDSDFDNYSDLEDNCPNQYNPGQKDYDSDGLGNDCDDDDDGDLVLDIDDKCPIGIMEWSSTEITDFDSDGCLDSLEDADDDNDGVIDARDKCPGEIPPENYVDSDLDGCLDSTEIKSDSSSFLSRLTAGDLDAIGIMLALFLPIIGLVYTSNAKSKRRSIMTRYEDKIFLAEDDGILDSIRKEVTSFASKDMISQAQYQVLIDMINLEREKIAISDIQIDEIFDEESIDYTIGDIITDEHGFEWKNDGNDIYYRHEESFPEWKKY